MEYRPYIWSGEEQDAHVQDWRTLFVGIHATQDIYIKDNIFIGTPICVDCGAVMESFGGGCDICAMRLMCPVPAHRRARGR